LESYREDYPKDNVICYKRHNSIYTSKGMKFDMSITDLSKENSKPEKVAKVIGLGYADFKDETDYRKRGSEVIKRKIKEVGI
jgi:hypothetical protein